MRTRTQYIEAKAQYEAFDAKYQRVQLRAMRRHLAALISGNQHAALCAQRALNRLHKLRNATMLAHGWRLRPGTNVLAR